MGESRSAVGLSVDPPPARAAGRELLRVEGLQRWFPIRGGVRRRVTGHVRAVDDVSFTIKAGETLGLVGETGCGKSTTGRAIVRLTEPTGGACYFDGVELTNCSRATLAEMRRQVQFVFQDPFSSLNPQMRIADIVAEPLVAHRMGGPAERRRRVAELLDMTGLSGEYADRYPHQLSGGQRQRVGIARALAVEPQLIILDEPVSSLDVSVQAQIINLLRDLQRDLGVAYLFIAHDLGVVYHISHRVAVMYLGRIVEMGTREAIYGRPLHPYTQALLSAVPVARAGGGSTSQRIVLSGDVPSPADVPSGCRFRTRCWAADEVCVERDPDLTDPIGDGRGCACHHPGAPRPAATGRQ